MSVINTSFNTEYLLLTVAYGKLRLYHTKMHKNKINSPSSGQLEEITVFFLQKIQAKPGKSWTGQENFKQSKPDKPQS